DGITEAMNTENEMFGDDRLQRIFDDNHRASLAETRDLILQSVQQYSTGENQQDDMTLVLVYCNA
ncbi:MAG: SpoIIE family protein phosphatase, partial [Calditrichaeota bacterium]|nr:SpoIIE family protein phosphatase [Calditrichota bacterium]